MNIRIMRSRLLARVFLLLGSNCVSGHRLDSSGQVSSVDWTLGSGPSVGRVVSSGRLSRDLHARLIGVSVKAVSKNGIGIWFVHEANNTVFRLLEEVIHQHSGVTPSSVPLSSLTVLLYAEPLILGIKFL